MVDANPSAELALPRPMGMEPGPTGMEPGPTGMDPSPWLEQQLHPAGSHPGRDARMSLRPHKPHIATGLGKLGKAASDPFWALSPCHWPHCWSWPWGQRAWGPGTTGSHLRQLRDLNQPLEVLQVAGAVEEVLQPARGREGLGTVLAQPRRPTPNAGSPRRVSPGHCAVPEGMVVCAATKPTAGPGKTPSPAAHLWQAPTAGGFLL